MTESGSGFGPGLGSRSFWLLVGLSLLVAAAVLLGLSVGVGVELDAPTFALAAACVAMIWALRALWGVVEALAQPPVESVLAEVGLAGEAAGEAGRDNARLAELREEKRRVLRAIKELEFDHAMGKLSDHDFKEIGDRYRLRAIEVLRELRPSSGGALHPLLVEHLAAAGVNYDGAAAAARAEAEPSDSDISDSDSTEPEPAKVTNP